MHIKNFLRILFLGSLLVCFPCLTFAAITLIDADDNINNLAETVDNIKSKTEIPIIFPTQVPKLNKDAKGYFANHDGKIDNQQYTITVDYTKECHSTHYCSAATVMGRIGVNPEMFYSMNNMPLTTEVTLDKNFKGFYTPGHPMGSYFSPTVQWRDGNILYSISWQISTKNQEEEKQTLIKIANSAIAAGSY